MIALLDWILFIITIIPVSYFFIFSFASLFDFNPNDEAPKNYRKFLFIFTDEGTKEDKATSLKSIHEQDYRSNYVGIDDEIANYDALILLESGATIKPNFLKEMNKALDSYNIVQAHIVTKNKKTTEDLFFNAIREMSNSIYKKGYFNLGYSSALDKTAIAVKADLLSSNDLAVDQLQALRRSGEKVGYLDKTFVRTHYNKDLKLKPRRRILLVWMFIIAIISQIISPPLALKWWGALAFSIFCIIMTIPYGNKT